MVKFKSSLKKFYGCDHGYAKSRPYIPVHDIYRFIMTKYNLSSDV